MSAPTRDDLTICIPCPPHTTTIGPGSWSRSQCVCDTPRLRYPVPAEDGGGCGCGAGYRYNGVLEACVACDPGTTSRNGSTQCTLCAAGYFQKELHREPATDARACLPCPASARCAAGSTIETIVLRRGFWRLTNRTSDVRPCAGGSVSAACLPNGTVGVCAEGHEGPLCALCVATDKYFEDGACVDCPDRSRVAILACCTVALMVLVAVGAAAVTYLVDRRKRPRTHALQLRARYLVTRCIALVKRLGLRAKLKVLVSFYQVATVVDSTYSVMLPEVYYRWTDAFRFIGEIDWTGIALPSKCLLGGYEYQMIVRATAPIICTLVVLLVLVLLHTVPPMLNRTKARLQSSLSGTAQTQWPMRQEEESGGLRALLFDGVRGGVLSSLPFMLLITYAFVPSVTASVFRTRSCIGYGVDDATGEERFFLRSEPSIECYGAEHDRLTSLMWVFIGIWPIGSVLLFALLLRLVHNDIMHENDTVLVRKTGFLTADCAMRKARRRSHRACPAQP